MKCEALFRPITIRGMTLKNRVMLPGMTTRLCLDGGYVSDAMIEYYTTIARGGCGLLVVEATSVHAPTAPRNFLQICTDDHIPGLKRLADAVHEAGAKISIQLWQGGFAASATDMSLPAIVPCDMEFRGVKFTGATHEMIHEAVAAFGAAAKRAVAAGFDAVEFHCGHQYSPAHFLCGFNTRTDEYGGCFENRMRYPLECVEAIRANVPEDFPIGMRVVALDDFIEGGTTLEQTIEFVNRAAEKGVDLLDVSRGNKFTAAFRYEVPSMYIPKGFNLDNAARIKAGVKIPVAGGGRVTDPELAESYLADGRLDMVFIGRPQICDPQWCSKAQEGRLDDIIRCLGCNQGCLDSVQQAGGSKHCTCLRNPFTVHSQERRLVKTAQPKTVVVIGGGVAGMECAYTLKEMGHNPVLLEASDRLGGQFRLAGMAPNKGGLVEAVVSRTAQLEKLGVDIRLNTKADQAVLDALKPDAVIIATGAAPIHFHVPGVDGENVHDFPPVLNGQTSFTGEVVVIGGGLVGIECASYLSQKGCHVSIVEMRERIGMDVSGGQTIDVMIQLQMDRINQIPNAKCVKIGEDGVTVDIAGEEKLIPCEHVVVAVGSKTVSHQWIDDYCADRGIPCKAVGDAVEARRALQAIQEAVDAALAI